MKYFFVSDYHFFHKNIIRYENRPFKTVEEMNETIITRHNERVKDNDIVYFLGDFAFYASKAKQFRGEGMPIRAEEIAKQLKGRWVWVKGNHDKSENKINIPNHRIILNKGGIYINLVHRLQDTIIYDYSYYYPLTLCGHAHCFDDKTEVLTNNGWRNLDTINLTDKPISLDLNNNKLKENKINEIVQDFIDDSVIKYNGHMNFCFTEYHRMRFKKYRQNNFETDTLNNLYKYKNSIFEVPISGYINHKGLDLTDDEIRLIVWISADGSIDFKRNSPMIRFKLSKKRKIKSLIKLLKKMGIEYSINKTKKECYQNLQPYRINLLKFKNSKVLKYFNKEKKLPKEFVSLSKRQVDIMFQTYIETDGILYKNQNIQISTSKKEECDLLQTIAIINGYSCCYSIRHFSKKKPNYVLCLVKNRTTLMLNTQNLYKERYTGRIWCLNVPLDTLITRRKGHVIISHNSKWQTQEIEKDNKISLAINCSVENNNYYPFTFDEIMATYHKWLSSHPKRKEINKNIIESRTRPIFVRQKEK